MIAPSKEDIKVVKERIGRSSFKTLLAAVQ